MTRRRPYPPGEHPVDAYIESLDSATSRRVQLAALELIAKLLSDGTRTAHLTCWHRVSYRRAVRMRAQLRERYKPATCRRMLCAFRGVIRAAWQMRYLSGDDHERLRQLPGVRGESLPPGRVLEPGELDRLLAVCADDPEPALGARDAAMVLVMAVCGLRRDEVRRLDVDDVDLEADRLVARGKGDRERAVPLRDDVRAALVDLLAIRGRHAGPVFTRHGAGVDRLSLSGINQALDRRATQARLRHSISPHDLRRTFVTALLEHGVDPLQVQRLAGHKELQTTMRYDRRGEALARKAVDRFPPTSYRPRARLRDGDDVRPTTDSEGLTCSTHPNPRSSEAGGPCPPAGLEAP